MATGGNLKGARAPRRMNPYEGVNEAAQRYLETGKISGVMDYQKPRVLSEAQNMLTARQAEQSKQLAAIQAEQKIYEEEAKRGIDLAAREAEVKQLDAEKRIAAQMAAASRGAITL